MYSLYLIYISCPLDFPTGDEQGLFNDQVTRLVHENLVKFALSKVSIGPFYCDRLSQASRIFGLEMKHVYVV